MSNSLPVLVVDDDPAILEIVKHLVERAGAQAVITDCSGAALTLAASTPFSAVIADYQMPDMLGPELLKRFAKIQPNASRIIMTGMPSLETVLRAVNEGEIYRFVTKPWVREEMTSTIRSAIDRFELLRDNQELNAQSLSLSRRLAELSDVIDKQTLELEEQRRLLAESRHNQESSFHRSLELCRRTLSTLSPLLAAQSKMASDLCSRLSAGPDFSGEERYALEVASQLYDIGLTGLPSQTLLAIQEEQHNLDESSEIIRRNHPIYGQTLVACADPCLLAGATVRSHHEHFDGSGYPDGLQGQEIPWTARCLTVVVDYVSKVSSGHTHETALEQLLRKSSIAFDPKALQLFLACIRERPISGNLQSIRPEDLKAGKQPEQDGATLPGGGLYIRGQKLDAETIEKLSAQTRSPASRSQLDVYRPDTP